MKRKSLVVLLWNLRLSLWVSHSTLIPATWKQNCSNGSQSRAEIWSLFCWLCHKSFLLCSEHCESSQYHLSHFPFADISTAWFSMFSALPKTISLIHFEQNFSKTWTKKPSLVFLAVLLEKELLRIDVLKSTPSIDLHDLIYKHVSQILVVPLVTRMARRDLIPTENNLYLSSHPSI